MKTKNLLLVLAVLFSLSLFAEHVTFEKYNQYESSIDFAALEITNTFINKPEQETFYYVFSFTNGGFVIVSADDCLTPVIGYSFKNDFVSVNQPPNVNWWFQQFEEQVIHVRQNNIEPKKETAEKWKHYQAINSENLICISRDDEVEPLLTTLWDQGWPYNYYCPETPTGGSGGHVWAGCVATASAQIGYYWRWPDNGQGYTSYIPTTHPEYGMQSADFGNTWYRYDEMCDDPQTINLAIAEDSYHVAVGLHMDFAPEGSAPTTSDSVHYYFKYFPSEYLYRDSMPDEQWKGILTNMLDDGYPIYYGGFPESGAGHAFVCDGYQEGDYFHFNLGWGGQSNGYYTIDTLAGFNFHQSILETFYPDTLNFSYPQYFNGTDTCLSFEGSIEDGSGPIHDYLNNTQASWLIDPQTEMDSVTSIELSVKRCSISGDGDYLRIYDGEDNTAPLLAELTGDTIPDKIESTGNKVFVEFTSNDDQTAPGFYLDYHVNLPVVCETGVIIKDLIATIADGSVNFPYRNSSFCSWYILPETDKPLTLHFNYFNTESGNDIVSIYDIGSEELIAEISGNYESPPEPVTAPSGQMMIFFSTNDTIREDGWEAWYDLVTTVEEKNSEVALIISPNPFTNTTNLEFEMQKPGKIELKIYNQLGELVETIQTNTQAGKQIITWDANDLPSGVYFIRLQIGNELITRKMIKLK